MAKIIMRKARTENTEGEILKDVEVKLIAELMKKSNRSDRELAKVVGVSQPTITRTRTRLEKEGMIKEYTIIPDFKRLGYEIMGATLLKIDKELGKEEFREVRKTTTKIEQDNPHAVILAVNGSASDKNRLFISFYETYSDYAESIELARQIPHVKVDSIENFLVDLNDETNYRILSMSVFADHLLQRHGKEKLEKSYK